MFEKNLTNDELSELLFELASIHNKPQNKHVEVILVESAKRIKIIGESMKDIGEELEEKLDILRRCFKRCQDSKTMDHATAMRTLWQTVETILREDLQ